MVSSANARGNASRRVHCPNVSRRSLALAGIALATGLSACQRRADIDVRLRLTFEIATELGSLVATGVWRFLMAKVPAMPGTRVLTWTEGQAIPIPIGNGSIFALLVWPGEGVQAPGVGSLFGWDGVDVLRSVSGLDLEWQDRDVPELRRLKASAPSPRYPVPLSRLPSLATFTNPEDPKSGRLVAPSELSTMSGRPALTGFTLQVVIDPVTKGVEAHLPWLLDTTAQKQPGLTSDDFAAHREYFLGWNL